MRIELTVNGKLLRADVPPMKLLLAVLREDFGFTGSKEGCGEGECGACSVIMDGCLVNACLVPAFQASGREILTIEGLGSSDSMDLLQKAFVSEGGVQCGFCTPGMIMAARALLEENPSPTLEEVKIALSGNICRCTGYEKIYDAIGKAIKDNYCATFRKRENLCGKNLPEPVTEEEKNFMTPENLKEAMEMLDSERDAHLLAGTTDIIPDIRNGKFCASKVIDLSRIQELKGINKIGSFIRIGSCATNGEIIRSGIIKRYLPALREASARSGAPAVQNRATIGGNLATASGAADLPSILLPLDASVVLESVSGSRTITLEKFIRGYRDPDRLPNEILKEIMIPVPKEGSVQKFFKRGSRKALTLSRISMGFYAEIEDGAVAEFRAGAGSMSPIPIRLPKLEASVRGKTLTEETIETAAETARQEVNPRKSSAWRKAMPAHAVRDFLNEIADKSQYLR